ncbi:uncharacterized protein LOC144102585 [Amblyomma americanum]
MVEKKAALMQHQFNSAGAHNRVRSAECVGYPQVADLWHLLVALLKHETLQEVTMPFCIWNLNQWDVLFTALPAKRSLKKVFIQMCENNYALMAEACIRDNYSLISITMDQRFQGVASHWFTVQDTVRRNSNLVSRAAIFLNGTLNTGSFCVAVILGHHSNSCRYYAQGLERVAGHPVLLEELADKLAVSETEAAEIAKKGLRRIEDLHAFMQIAGVVRERVVCHPSKDGSKQLDSLHEYCWRKVRSYLMIEDVKK